MTSHKRSSIVTFTFEACERIRQAKTLDDARVVLVNEMKWFGFEYLTCAGAPVGGLDPAATVTLNTRPVEYGVRYHEQGHAYKDPVATHLRMTLNTYSWDDVRAARSLSKAERDIMDEGREFRMCNGLVIPVVTTTGSLALVLPCGEKPDLSAPAKSAATMIGMLGYQAIKRLHLEQLQLAGYSRVRLTPREREILQWLLAGKTDDEVGEILSISARTVRHLVDSAKQKLETHSRQFALAEALRRGEIAL